MEIGHIQKRHKEVNRVDQTEKNKLMVLLDYWVKHNSEHSGEFKEWAEKVQNLGETAIYNDIIEAVEQMDKANAPLLRALARLKGE